MEIYSTSLFVEKLHMMKVFVMNNLIRVVLAIILPPFTVYLVKGAGKSLMTNVILCLIFYVPAILHALWVVQKYGTGPFYQALEA